MRPDSKPCFVRGVRKTAHQRRANLCNDLDRSRTAARGLCDGGIDVVARVDSALKASRRSLVGKRGASPAPGSQVVRAGNDHRVVNVGRRNAATLGRAADLRVQLLKRGTHHACRDDPAMQHAIELRVESCLRDGRERPQVRMRLDKAGNDDVPGHVVQLCVRWNAPLAHAADVLDSAAVENQHHLVAWRGASAVDHRDVRDRHHSGRGGVLRERPGCPRSDGKTDEDTSHSVFKKAINAFLSSAARSRPKRWPFTARVFRPYPMWAVGT